MENSNLELLRPEAEKVLKTQLNNYDFLVIKSIVFLIISLVIILIVDNVFVNITSLFQMIFLIYIIYPKKIIIGINGENDTFDIYLNKDNYQLKETLTSTYLTCYRANLEIIKIKNTLFKSNLMLFAINLIVVILDKFI